ncbi:hypothetical protein P280DRAFT_479148 [Massarina eburnea CBS 473.64]|uniref:Uncharacterized protein n=1 Tax=Massarina eburnea CBS 473.64 TaxID=1395130 RepID=A0A6A6S3K3_9PLEO|nr:hypothetical protein P280DRAFT_479148 [Massarina eburnea CBS 473.64]
MRATPLLALRILLIILFNVFVHTPVAEAQASTSTPSLHSQRFVHPSKGDVLVTGDTFTIRWTTIPQFGYVTLQLWDKTSYGYSHDLTTPCYPYARSTFCGTIATHVPNNGSHEWRIPFPANGTNNAGYTFPRGEKVFWVKLFVEDFIQSSIGNKDPVLSFSQNFAFAKEGESGTVVSVDLATVTSARQLPLETVVLTSMVHESGSTGKLTGNAETATATRIPARNGTAFDPVQGAASKKQNLLGAALVVLGALARRR